ncbi:hypothetical protein F1880_006820 [Penicillium rolfsii]|nr:hypothetical protein F1880_006820 [Penicillium rolfsii]
MSDDEDYYEWEEDYPFEDLVPDLVDELAASSNYEAQLYEDPKMETNDYLSDWEYYSDDYHDDDPSVKQNPITARRDAAAPKTRRAQSNTQRNGVSRPRSSLKPDMSSFQGVIWRTPSMGDGLDLAVQIYEPGNGEKIAFLENWREIFKSAQPALDKSRLRNRQASYTPPKEEPEFADDEFPGEDEYDDDEVSSDEMSDILSNDNTAATDDAGDASNTTPELEQSPQEVPMPVDSAPAKRGRKRKADVPPEEPNKDNPGGEETRARTKRVASARSNASSGPVRRSARQMK